jgi:hypothetical protein
VARTTPDPNDLSDYELEGQPTLSVADDTTDNKPFTPPHSVPPTWQKLPFIDAVMNLSRQILSTVDQRWKEENFWLLSAYDIIGFALTATGMLVQFIDYCMRFYVLMKARRQQVRIKKQLKVKKVEQTEPSVPPAPRKPVTGTRTLVTEYRVQKCDTCQTRKNAYVSQYVHTAPSTSTKVTPTLPINIRDYARNPNPRNVNAWTPAHRRPSF